MSQIPQSVIVHPASSISGSVDVPGDKSIAHRIAMMAGLASGTSTVRNFPQSGDCMSTLRAMEALWADLSRNEEDIQSRSWHGQVLEERAARVKSGQEKFIDWEAAKQELRDRLT